MTSKRLYKSKTGDLIIEQSNEIPSPDDTAYINGNLAPTGKYEVGEEKFIHISNGKVYATRGQIEPGLEVELIDSETNSSNENSNSLHNFIKSIRRANKGYLVIALVIFLILYALRLLNSSEVEINSTQNLPESIKKRMRDSIDLASTKTLPTNDPRTQIPYSKAKYEIDTLNLKYLLEYADILALTGQSQNAFNLLNQTLRWADKKAKIYHGKFKVWQTVATIQQQNGLEFKSALDSSIYYVEKAFETDTTDIDIIITLSGMHQHLKQHDKAIQDIERAMKIQPNNRTLYLFRGALKFELSDFKGAHDDLTPITDIRRMDYTWFFYRGLASAELGNYIEAVQDLDTCEMLNFKDPQLYYHRGKIKTHLKDRKREGFLEVKKASQMGYPVSKEVLEKIAKKLKEVAI